MSSKSSKNLEHVVLVGDSILDNGLYVHRDHPDVVQHLQSKIKRFNWTATNCAVDGAITKHVIRDQISTIPPNATTVVISCGGNDGLETLHNLATNSNNWFPWNFVRILLVFRWDFQDQYSLLLRQIKRRYPNAKVICNTIYYPHFEGMNVMVQMVSNIGVNLMSNVIIQCALDFGNIPVIDLRHVFDRKEDYANSIEPGVPGSDKLTNNIVHILKHHDFQRNYNRKQDVIYKLKEYSDGMDPQTYGALNWDMTDMEREAGGVATRFFRRAFNERQNREIKIVAKIGIFTMAALSAYFVWRHWYQS